MKMVEVDEFTKTVKYLKCRSFLPDYCGIKYTSGILRKLSGKNANGNSGRFSREQRRQIIEGVKRLLDDLNSSNRES
jgi:hypothetical protein